MEHKGIDILDIILAKAMVGDATAAAARAKEYAEAAKEYAESIDPSKFATLAALETGAVIPAKALAAKTLENVSENSGSTQTTPFFFQATGTNNNTDATPTAPIAKQLEVRGNTVCVNNIVQNGNFADASRWSSNRGSITVADNKCTFTSGDAPAASSGVFQSCAFLPHKYIASFYVTASRSTTVGVYFGGRSYAIKSVNAGVRTLCSTIGNSPATAGTFNIYVNMTNTLQEGDTVVIESVICSDLTLWYGSDSAIPAYLLTHPEWFVNCYDGELTYGTGALESADADELTTVGKNIWKEEWELGAYDTTTGAKNSVTTQIRCKNLIRVIGGQSYHAYCGASGMWALFYDRNGDVLYRPLEGQGITRSNNAYQVGNATSPVAQFTVPSNCAYMSFYMTTNYGTTYNNNISIYLSWDGELGDQYFPYWSKKYPITWTRQPKSAGSAYDYKTSDGTEHYKIASVKVSNTTVYTSSASYHIFYVVLPNGKLPSVGGERLTGIISSMLPVDTTANVSDGMTDLTIKRYASSGNCLGLIRDLSCETAEDVATKYADMVFYYELAEEEVVNGEPFAEEVEVDDYGTMAFNSVVPQGCRFFYPADYALLIDDLNNYTEGDVTNLALKSDIKSFYQHNLDILLSGDFSTTHVYMSYVNNSATPIALVDIGTSGNPVTGKPYSATAVAIVNPIGAITFGTSPDATLTYLDGTTVSVEIASITDNVG